MKSQLTTLIAKIYVISCSDLFASEIQGQYMDDSDPPGGDSDDWPFINIYGSCKTCDAYVLDYFAEKAFASVEAYLKQTIMYLTSAMIGFAVSILCYMHYRASPQRESEVELLSSDGGVIA